MQLVVLGATAFFAAVVGSITGGGVTAILLPVLVVYVGIQEAVPIVTIVLLVASVSRIVVYRRDVDVPVIAWFTVGSLPATVLGTLWFTTAAPSVLTRVHRIELQNAWQLKVYRKEMPADAAARAADDLQSDIDAGIWSPPEYDLASMFALSVRLAREHTAILGTRSLDVLHVAAALELRERNFVTGDARQAKLAKAVGLTVTKL